MIGRKLGNRYEIIEKLGGGGMAIVYKAMDTYLNRLVTIKILRPEFTSDEDFVRRFRREAQAVASLSHPNIVNIHDVGREDNVHYLVMEYVSGDNLKAVIVKNRRLDPDKAVRFAIQICAALEHAHQNNIVHRDVKPHNILVTDEGQAKLTDFGIALEATAATITRSDTIMGSVHYLSPEQIRGETATAKSDIYAVGILLYEMLTGEHPYSGDTAIAIALKHVQETPRPVNQVNLDVPKELATLVMRAMEKDADRRYQSAEELARHLETVFDDTTEATVFIPAAEMTQRMENVKAKSPAPNREKAAQENATTDKRFAFTRKRMWIAVIFVLVAGLLGGGGYGFFRYLNVHEINVPSVVGKPIEEAREQLETLGLKVDQVEKYSDEEVGMVIDQDIGPSDPAVKPGRVITLTVSKGEEMKVIPSLYGLTATDAENELRQAGLVPAPYNEDYHPEMEKGLVFAQLPAAGAKVSKGAQVHFTVSLGPQPEYKLVPNLIGRTIEEARKMLKDLNLILNEEEKQYDFNPDFPWDRIIEQNPEVNSEVQEGTRVKVVLNKDLDQKRKQAMVKITDEIPDDGGLHKVEIVVDDLEGRKVQYSGSHGYGDEIRKRITYVGDGVLSVYIDGNKIMDKELN